MRRLIAILMAATAVAVAGCQDSSSPRDVTPPAAPRGLFSVTGDQRATLSWLANTEADVAGYRVYEASCASGSSCPYDRIGATAATQFVANGLANGVTRYFAVSAVDNAGNESPLTYEDVYDTPRPAGTATLNNFVNTFAGAGWDFSAFTNVAADGSNTDIFFGDNGNISQMFATLHVVAPGDTIPNDIQDAGYATTLDAVDFSPVGDNAGWSPTGTVELIQDHCYIVWTWDNHYAKFRVTGITRPSPGQPATLVRVDWAYQTATGNNELRARPVHTAVNSPRTVAWLR